MYAGPHDWRSQPRENEMKAEPFHFFRNFGQDYETYPRSQVREFMCPGRYNTPYAGTHSFGHAHPQISFERRETYAFDNIRAKSLNVPKSIMENQTGVPSSLNSGPTPTERDGTLLYDGICCRGSLKEKQASSTPE